MVKYKKKSKRVPMKRQAKIRKKIKEHHRKVRRAARQAQHPNAKYKPRGLGIPNNFPLKEEMLADAIAQKQEEEMRAEEERQRMAEKKEERRLMREKIAEEMGISLQEAERELRKMEKDEAELQETEAKERVAKQKKAKAKAAWEDFKDIVARSEIVLLTVNATDPLACRNRELEEYITKDGKQLFIVLTKADLVPFEVTKRWLDVFRLEYPTFFIKNNFASNWSGKRRQQYYTKNTDIDEHHAIGLKQLVKGLQDASLALQDKISKVHIGVVGYPQTGKKALLNTLRVESLSNIHRSQAPNLVRLHDCPGWFWDTPGRVCITPPPTVLSHTFVSSIQDTTHLLRYICARVPFDRLRKVFNLPKFSRFEEFVHHYAQKYRCLKKGGTLDLELAMSRITEAIYSSEKNIFALPTSYSPSVNNTGEWQKLFPRWEEITAQDDVDLGMLLSLEDLALESLPMSTGSFGISPFLSGQAISEAREEMERKLSIQLPQDGKTSAKKSGKKHAVKFASDDDEESEDDLEYMEDVEDSLAEEADEAELDRIQAKRMQSKGAEDDYDFGAWDEENDEDDDDEEEEGEEMEDSDEDNESVDHTDIEQQAQDIMQEYYDAMEEEDSDDEEENDGSEESEEESESESEESEESEEEMATIPQKVTRKKQPVKKQQAFRSIPKKAQPNQRAQKPRQRQRRRK